jgi:hypothetical protein
MKMQKLRTLLPTIAILALLSGCGQDASVQNFDQVITAEPPGTYIKDFGDYVLHFNGLTTESIQPKIAQQYDIVRSKERVLLTVSIIKKKEGTPGIPVSGKVSATANNLTGQLKNLNMRSMPESGAFYYIGEVKVANGETLIFNITATPDTETESYSVRFMQQFFTN